MQKSKQIEMEEIVDNHQVVGTEIFQPNMPSNIDFDDKAESNSPNKHAISHQEVPQMNKTLVIGDELCSFSVRGKLTAICQPKFLPAVPITVSLNTLPATMEDEQISGLKKLWSSLVGSNRRQVLIQDGYIYILEKQKQGLFVKATFNLAMLFKVFVDPQEEKIRLVVRQQQHLITRDLYPANFIVMTQKIQSELLRIGLSLVQ